jgi:hypothetical protein
LHHLVYTESLITARPRFFGPISDLNAPIQLAQSRSIPRQPNYLNQNELNVQSREGEDSRITFSFSYATSGFSPTALSAQPRCAAWQRRSCDAAQVELIRQWLQRLHRHDFSSARPIFCVVLRQSELSIQQTYDAIRAD